jgi:hypothetical protein
MVLAPIGDMFLVDHVLLGWFLHRSVMCWPYSELSQILEAFICIPFKVKRDRGQKRSIPIITYHNMIL